MKIERFFIPLQWSQCLGAVPILAVLAVAVILWPQSATGQLPTVPKLTFGQVEQLVLHGVPDSTLSTQIQKRGLGFTPTAAIVESLRAKGAGPQTLAAIEALVSKGGSSRSVVKAEPSRKISISAGVAVGLLLQKTAPVYPLLAKAARISGTVVLQATISKTGSIEELHVVSGPPLLQGAALEAVKAWQYRPFLLEGKPVEVETTINVIFTLGDGTPQTSNTAIKPSDSGPSLAETLQARDKAKQEAREKVAREQQEKVRQEQERIAREEAAKPTWTDPATGLTWMKKDNGYDVNWQQAKDYCRNLQLADYSGWRLPTIDELLNIYDSNISYPGVAYVGYGGSQVTWHVKGNLDLSGWHWSSTEKATGGDPWHFGLYFAAKRIPTAMYNNNTGARALCVR
jgi:TonB family protein